MLVTKATELTKAIFDPLDIGLTESQVVSIHSVILKCLEDTYLQGRKDQVLKVCFLRLSDGSIKFLYT